MKRGKKAQFYIIAAVIIAVLIAGLATTINYAVTSQTPTRFYDLSKSYNLEAAKVIDYGVYQKYTPAIDIKEKIINFTYKFYKNAQLKDPNIEIIALYGDSTEATGISYSINDTNFSSGTNSIEIKSSTIKSNIQNTVGTSQLGGSYSAQSTQIPTATIRPQSINGKYTVNISIPGNSYEINLNASQTFYFILQSKKPSGEVNVATG